MDRFYLGAYWEDRPEDLHSCVTRYLTYLDRLATMDELFCEWSSGGNSETEARGNRIQINRTTIIRLIQQGTKCELNDGNMTNKSGFSMGLWNMRPANNGSVTISITCGLHAGIPGLLNRCIIKLPNEGNHAERIVKVDFLCILLKQIAEVFRPDWGIVTSHLLLRKFSQSPARVPEHAWITYLSSRRGNVPQLKTPCRVAIWPNLGSAIILTDEHFDVTRNDHIRLADIVYQTLHQLGLLGPTPQKVEKEA